MASDHGFDVVDLHFAFRRHINNRADDGIHWNGIVHRAITNLLLWHVCDAWHVKLPSSSPTLTNEPPQHQQDPSLMTDGGFHSDELPFDSGDRSASDYGVRFCPQQTQHPDSYNYNESGESSRSDDRVNFGCYSPRMRSRRGRPIRRFGRELTNRRHPRSPALARRGKRGLRNNTYRPY